jgi:hypothetical protein
MQYANKSYIRLENEDKQKYREIRIRDLSVQELCIGRIIIHTLLWLCFTFSNDREIIEIIFNQDH